MVGSCGGNVLLHHECTALVFPVDVLRMRYHLTMCRGPSERTIRCMPASYLRRFPYAVKSALVISVVLASDVEITP